MTTNDHFSPGYHLSPIRITGLNKDKTRKPDRSGTMYLVHFELSENPSQDWKDIFEHEWKAIAANFSTKTAPNEAAVDRGFLTVFCPLVDVGSVYLPALRKAVAATNSVHAEHLRRQGDLQTEKENIWKVERKAVEAMAATLSFTEDLT